MKADMPLRDIPPHREGWTHADWAVSNSGRSHRSRHGNGALNQDASSASILVVDDDPRSLTAVEALLADTGPKLVLAASGEEALRRVEETDFAVILLDVKMQGVDGFTAAKRIRARDRSRYTPIIFVTAGYEDVSAMFKGYEAGAVDFIVKPVVPAVLKSKIAVFVELYQMNDALKREIAERKKVEAYLRTSKQNLRALAARQQSIREDESIRIAREIHDELGQSLTALKMTLTWIVSRLPPDRSAFNGKIDLMFKLIDGTIQTVRKISAGLRPEVLDQLGLVAACSWLARDFQVRTGIRCGIVLPDASVNIDKERAIAVFRVFQELLTNVARHANADKVDVLMEVRDQLLTLEVKDNGKGIAGGKIDSASSLGFLGMRERVLPFGGTVEVVETSDKGTWVRVSIPLK